MEMLPQTFAITSTSLKCNFSLHYSEIHVCMRAIPTNCSTGLDESRHNMNTTLAMFNNNSKNELYDLNIMIQSREFKDKSFLGINKKVVKISLLSYCEK